MDDQPFTDTVAADGQRLIDDRVPREDPDALAQRHDDMGHEICRQLCEEVPAARQTLDEVRAKTLKYRSARAQAARSVLRYAKQSHCQ